MRTTPKRHRFHFSPAEYHRRAMDETAPGMRYDGGDVRRCVGRAIIDDNNLAWSAGLTHYAVKGSGQKFGSVMNCNYNGNHALFLPISCRET